jgi:hypothetical protein
MACQQLSIDLFGVVHGAAEGSFAVGLLALLAIAALAVLRFPNS